RPQARHRRAAPARPPVAGATSERTRSRDGASEPPHRHGHLDRTTSAPKRSSIRRAALQSVTAPKKRVKRKQPSARVAFARRWRDAARGDAAHAYGSDLPALRENE